MEQDIIKFFCLDSTKELETVGGRPDSNNLFPSPVTVVKGYNPALHSFLTDCLIQFRQQWQTHYQSILLKFQFL